MDTRNSRLMEFENNHTNKQRIELTTIKPPSCELMLDNSNKLAFEGILFPLHF